MPIFLAEFVKLSSIQALLLFIGHNFSPKIEAEHPLFVCCEMLAISMYPHMLIAIMKIVNTLEVSIEKTVPRCKVKEFIEVYRFFCCQSYCFK